jgi:hypothetical protein
VFDAGRGVDDCKLIAVDLPHDRRPLVYLTFNDLDRHHFQQLLARGGAALGPLGQRSLSVEVDANGSDARLSREHEQILAECASAASALRAA